MSARAEKTALFEAIAVMGKAFASPRRLELLDLLAQAPRTVDELAQAIEQSTANTSQHLQALHAAGLVTREREGTSVSGTAGSSSASISAVAASTGTDGWHTANTCTSPPKKRNMATMVSM